MLIFIRSFKPLRNFCHDWCSFIASSTTVVARLEVLGNCFQDAEDENYASNDEEGCRINS